MAEWTLILDRSLVDMLEHEAEPIGQAARESMVLELYGRRVISSGKAARLLGMERFDFIRSASDLGIPFIDMTEEEWEAELQAVQEIVAERRSSLTPAH